MVIGGKAEYVDTKADRCDTGSLYMFFSNCFIFFFGEVQSKVISKEWTLRICFKSRDEDVKVVGARESELTRDKK